MVSRHERASRSTGSCRFARCARRRRVLRRRLGVLWVTVDPTHLARRLHIAIEPLGVLTAVSHRIGGGVAVGMDKFSLRWSPTQLSACGEEEERSPVDGGRSHPLGCRAFGRAHGRFVPHWRWRCCGWVFSPVRWSRTQLWACGEEEERSLVDDARSHPLGSAVAHRYRAFRRAHGRFVP